MLTFVLFGAYCGRLQPITSVGAIVRIGGSAKCDKSVEWRPAVMTMTQHNIYTKYPTFTLSTEISLSIPSTYDCTGSPYSHRRTVLTCNLYQKTIFILTRNLQFCTYKLLQKYLPWCLVYSPAPWTNWIAAPGAGVTHLHLFILMISSFSFRRVPATTTK